MKKFLAVLAVAAFALTLSAAPKNLFSAASVKKESGVTTMVTGINIPVKSDAASLKNFVKNDFYKAFNIGKDVEPQLLRAVKIDSSSIYKFVPFYKGIKVDGVYTVLTVRNGKVDQINNGLDAIDIDITKMIAPEAALKSAMAARNMKVTPKVYDIEKIIVKHLGRFVPAYKVRFAPISLADSRYYIVDARSGKVIRSGNSTYFADTDAGNTDTDAGDSDAGDTEPADSGNTDTGDTDTGDTDVVEKVCKAEDTNMAKIWKYNPIVTPDLEEVELPWVAPYNDKDLSSDLLGTLITEKDEKGIRKIKSYNCPDDGTMISIDPASMGIDLSSMGITEIKIHSCHPMPLADKCVNGSFIYDDCESGHEYSEEGFKPENIDRCSEISMYYHASKIYNYIRSIYSDLDSDDSFYLQNNTADKPLNVISNFVMPDFNDYMGLFSGTNKLAPMDNAFFTEDNPLFSTLLADFGISGDLLVFGQGSKCDFGYDGDVIYHEFGHATLYTTGITGLEYADKYGMTVEPGSLHEGMADTFAFIMTDNSCTGEYASEGIMKYYEANGMTEEQVIAAGGMDKEGDSFCMRTAKNQTKVFEDFVGEVHHDGQPLLASNWDIYQLVKGEGDTQEVRDNLAKLFLKTLYKIGDANVSYKLWADTLMAEVEKDDNFKAKKDDIRKILEDRNFFEEVRARSVNERIAASMYIPAGGGSAAGADDDPTGGLMGGNGGGILVVDGDNEVKVGPAYIQYYYDVPEDNELEDLKITASIAADSSSSMLGGIMGGGAPTLEVYYRKGAPIEYEGIEDGAATVKKDGKVAGSSNKGWYIPEAEAGERYYIQFVNTAAAAGTAANILVVPSDAPKEDVAPDTDTDTDSDDMSYDDDPQEEDTGKKKKSGGCSLMF